MVRHQQPVIQTQGFLPPSYNSQNIFSACRIMVDSPEYYVLQNKLKAS
jgi:hypothetical protein